MTTTKKVELSQMFFRPKKMILQLLDINYVDQPFWKIEFVMWQFS